MRLRSNTNLFPLLSTVLFRDVRRPSGLMPLLGIDQHQEMAFERALVERKLAAEALQNCEALIECLVADFDDFDQGKITEKQLLDSIWDTTRALDLQTRFNEARAIQTTIELAE